MEVDQTNVDKIKSYYLYSSELDRISVSFSKEQQTQSKEIDIMSIR